MLLLAALAGLRRSEIAKVHTQDIRRDAFGAGMLRVRGKGDKEREIPIHPALMVLLDRLEPGCWAFPGQIDGHVSPDWVGTVIRRRLGGGWTAHTLRHSFASRAYAVERDLRAVQELLGHSKPETTAIYTAIPAGALVRAVNAL